MDTQYLLMSLIKTVGKMRMLAYSFSDDSTAASFESERRRDWRSNGLQNEASKAPQLDNSGGGLESAKAEPRT